RAFARLKSWHTLRQARCSTNHISRIVQAVHTLPTCDYPE
ncbi:IS5/IS1182 family transposase, partial [Streptomyces albireticuli]|nr:IS5/IS1182 family transposase [Streptomyces albireticuli]MCD9166267.1 IS5/IS1182 family transposase [Streptomyces albireticuli]